MKFRTDGRHLDRMRRVATSAVVCAGLLLVACGDTDDVDAEDADPLAHCPIPEDAETREPDLMGDCSYAESRALVLDSFDALGDEGILCEAVVDELEALMLANPDQHVALIVRSATDTCGLTTESAVVS